MCGIFGVILRAESSIAATDLEAAVRDLFHLSESRGKEAAGIAISTPECIRVYKDAISASELLRTPAYRRIFDESFDLNGHSRTRPDSSMLSQRDEPPTPTNGAGGYAIIGHSRLVTNGAEILNENNQPVITEQSVAIHNGIICNDRLLWERHPGLPRAGEIDTEVLVRLIEKHTQNGASLPEAVRAAFAEIEGTASVAVLLKDYAAILLATNNGSLYAAASDGGDAVIFASERYILEQLARRPYVQSRFGALRITHCEPGTACLIHTASLRTERFHLKTGDGNGHAVDLPRATPRSIVSISNGISRTPARASVQSAAAVGARARDIEKLLLEGTSRVPGLRRCTKCILPETMPFIIFDDAGVCSYCRNYEPIQPLGHDALMQTVEPFRRPGSEPECVLALSGGRDSTYSLHYVKCVLGLKPIAYTYDWGMVTDLARRNQARICGKLGVEHILVSADIRRKRDYIRMNVSAWLRRPRLGTVPLFMAGDKQFFYYANKLRRDTGVPALVFSMNPLERTDFKTGYCGVRRSGVKGRFYGLPVFAKAQLAWYYAKEYLLNPAYLNASLWDTLHAYYSYYVIPQDYVQFFHYIRWNEPTITRTLIDEYDWEVATDTQTTWRIGDGTAAFYNYIYYTATGFSENDTFRSNQIREGMIDRETALANVKVENQPRAESIQWYCDTIGIDAERAIRTINAMPKLYDR